MFPIQYSCKPILVFVFNSLIFDLWACPHVSIQLCSYYKGILKLLKFTNNYNVFYKSVVAS
jgi:hypothetical protein